ncbi:MAG: hypothetical protein AB7K52_12850 [Phycisphaerales bacterium]
MHRSPALATCVFALVLASCAGRGPVDPADQARNAGTDVPTRVAAVDELWARDRATDHEGARESLKRLAWQAGITAQVRVRAIQLLVADPADENHADSRNMLRLMLPTEPNMLVITAISRAAEQGGWSDLTPALIRSYSRKTDPPPDPQRPERAALLAIHPGKSIEQIAFDQFLAPLVGAGAELDRSTKARAAAWELLSRLDADGSRRAQLLAGHSGASDHPAINDLRACAADLRCIPLTAAQLDWLAALRDFRDPSTAPARQAWWQEAAACVAALPADRLEGWALRHVAPLAWARAHRPDLLSLDRAALASALREQFRGRAIAVRGDADRGGGELFADRAGTLCWGELLAIAVADLAVRDPAVATALAGQVQRDRADTSTEYGGILGWARASSGGGAWRALLYTPRPGQRGGDNQFTPPPEMLAEGARDPFHYHFHVQRDENRDYAGPGPGDLQFADAHGRANLVFTTIRTGVLNADYYAAGGVIVDLGHVTFGP